MGLTWPAGRRHARQLSRTEPARGWALVLTSAAFFMVALDALVVITALLSLTILTVAWPAQRRGTIVGIWGGIAGLAVAAGPLVGGAVVQGLNWHWIFWVNVPIGLAAAVGSVVKLSESRGPATRLDIPGVVLVTAAAGGILWGLVRGGETGWGTGEVIAA